MSLISPLNNLTKPTSGFGIGITSDNKPLASEINDIGNRIVKNNKKAINELTKYKQVNDLNKKLSQSYRENLQVMIDISKLLNSYASFFEILKGELEKNEKSLGDLELKDVENIENLTREKMDRFNNEFQTQSDKVKSLYKKFGQNDEFNRLSTLQQGIPQVSNAANIAKQNIKTISQQSNTSLKPQNGFFWGGKNIKKSSRKKA